MSEALLVIDVQMAMFDPRDPVWCGEQLLNQIAYLIEEARKKQVLVVYVQHDGPPGSLLDPHSAAHAIHPRVAPRIGDPIVHKTTPDSFYRTPLDQWLRGHGVDKLVITGIQTEICIDATCKSAVSHDYAVTLAGDAHSTWGRESLSAQTIVAHHNSVIGEWFGRVARSKDLWQG
ncbi:MAG: cysteine hydrolase family protein [Sulfobacillus sp.]